jgi:hypothetical protein
MGAFLIAPRGRHTAMAVFSDAARGGSGSVFSASCSVPGRLPEGQVDDAVRGGAAAAQAVQVLKIAARRDRT